jgi:hypothetical protein
MKILSKKKYNQLLQEVSNKDNKISELTVENAMLKEELEDKKTSYKANVGKEFCNVCKNSYSYRKNSGLVAINYVGCLLDVPCEDFKKKEDN